ncbi:MAG: type IV secretion system DNA-binding domain-containing protein, partial [Candidatus Staskawiczbacteria bacterium]|nr:type IV secretion system DNA-binding domain-containing protein [Candidatus Staskawiczbacteria bacterium]
MPKDLTYIAKTNFRKAEVVFGIKRPDRRQHMYIIGKTGAGKTAFLKNMALQDINNGQGLAIIDPHGEFVEEVLDNIPLSRVNDVVYFNPADMEFPVSFNIMDVQDPKYKHLIASGLIGIFTKIWANVWSARMEYILANCILALLDTPGTTLLGIPRMLVDRDYRQKIINNLKDPVVKSFWINEYEELEPRYRNEAI